MLENYDTRYRIRELARDFEAEHAQHPYMEVYAQGIRRAYAAFTELAGPERGDLELRGILDATLAVVQEVGLESAQFLLAVESAPEA